MFVLCRQDIMNAIKTIKESLASDPIKSTDIFYLERRPQLDVLRVVW